MVIEEDFFEKKEKTDKYLEKVDKIR